MKQGSAQKKMTKVTQKDHLGAALKKINFEHNSNPVLPVKKFVWRLIRYTLFAIFLISISLLIGILGYMYFAELNWIDSLHMSSLILTGMGPVIEMKTVSAKLFSSFYALYSGVAFLSIMAIIFSPIVHRLLHILHVNLDEKEEEGD